MAKKKSTKKLKRMPPTKEPLAPSRLVSEKMLRDVHRVLEKQEFQTTKEANAFLATLTGSGLKQAVEKVPELSPQEEAQELAYSAMEASTRAQALALARQALAKDPDCVDALVVVATANARSEEDFLAGLEKAVSAGERALGAAYFAENKGHFWGLLETRPYMRARQQLVEALLDLERVSEAISHLEAMLDLNPNDNQGLRDILLGCYLSNADLNGARRLLRDYAGDISAVFNWGRTLERILSKDFEGAEQALQHARQRNRFIELYLTGRKRLPRTMPDCYSFGSEEEAILCLDILGEAWAKHQEALIWLITQFVAEEKLPNKPKAARRQSLLF